MKKKTSLTLKEACLYLGCPKSFLKSEIERGRLSYQGRFFNRKIKRFDLDLFRSETAQSVVWSEFEAAGYKPNPNI